MRFPASRGSVGFALLFCFGLTGHAQTAQNVLLVVNNKSELSRRIGDYYIQKRSIPAANVCRLNTTDVEEIEWNIYLTQIERPLADCLTKGVLQEKILYIALTGGVPFKVQGAGGSPSETEYSSVDSELALLYGKLKGRKTERKGFVPNPFFGKQTAVFGHPQFPIYLVTRLAAYDFNDVKAMIDRSLLARNSGKVILDLKSADDVSGNDWLRNAALLLPEKRVVVEETPKVLYDQRDVIAFASWGSNDKSRSRRWLGFQWMPGAIATEYVSTNMRTLKPPPDNWQYTTWEDHAHYWAGSPQGLTADLIHEGATGAAGNVSEPYLGACAHPDQVFSAYLNGRNLAESFYLGLPYLSWQSVILGDPLTSLGKP